MSNNRMRLVIVVFSVLCLGSGTLAESLRLASVQDTNKYCFRCHSMGTLSYKDETTGIIKNLAVVPEEFYNSNHKNLTCTECHSKEFDKFPHDKKLRSENLYCLNCHKDEPKFKKFHFESIESEFKQSVHYQKLKDKFSCFDCHDPHSFKINARVNQDVKQTILYDNLICLNCHENNSKIKYLSGIILPSLNSSHSWLPHLDLHLKSVRCIDCHTSSNAPGVSHAILPKEKAVKNCVECHSKNSLLVQTLYKFQSKESRNKEGFLNAVILNNSYVIGATRNYYLNLLSFIIFGITLTALLIHGILRFRGKKRKLK